MNSGISRSWLARMAASVRKYAISKYVGRKTIGRPLLSALLLFSIVAEILSPLVVLAAPPLPTENDPVSIGTIVSMQNGVAPPLVSSTTPSVNTSSIGFDSLLDPSAVDPSGESATDGRNLPADVAELPEIMERRTANSATFMHDDKTLTSILAAEPLHYRDTEGNWQAIDATFHTLDDSYTVEQNSIMSRAGMEKAWLSAVANETAILWEAQTLAAVSATDASISLANALDNPASSAQRSKDGSILRYASTWSDPDLREEFHSAPGSLEHVLVLTAPPQAPQAVGGS